MIDASTNKQGHAMQQRKFTGVRAAALALSIAMIALALINLHRANAGVTTERVMLGPTPVTIFRANPSLDDKASPLVLIAHGFAGSQQLMQGFAVTLAKNGFIAVTFDYYGHGRNLEPLRGDVTKVDGATQKLLEQTREVADYALELPGVSGELALLGHSMASDIIVRYAQEDPRVDATVAVSMFSPAVTAEAPKNLLVIVGGWEGFLKEEALRVLGLITDKPEAGQTFESNGAAEQRRVAIAEGVEHVGVLYSQTSMAEASDWLHRVYAKSLLADQGYRDKRGGWVVMLLFGLCALAWPLASLLPTVSSPPLGASLTWKQLLPASLVPAIGTPLALFWFPADFLGVLVGGYLAVHFAVYGLLTLLCLWWLKRGIDREQSITHWGRFALSGALATLFTAAVISLALNIYVTSFAIPTLRIPLLLVMLVGTLCYFLADEWLAHGSHTAQGGHLFTRVCFLVSLGIAVALSFEDLFFLLIIAAVIIIYFLVYGLFSRWVYQATGHPAVGGIANAVAFAWALAAVFPLMAP
ncbi:MAG: alpha/beta hydrolase [Congregibacter sp.]